LKVDYTVKFINYDKKVFNTRQTRWIKEAIHIRKEGQRAMTALSHAFDCFLGTCTSTFCVKNRMKKFW